MTHRCPIAGCTSTVADKVFMCARHWRLVPRPLQQAVYQSYRSTMNALSANHREAVRVVQQAEAGRKAPGIEPGMKALTIWQPWASLIMIGAKPYEFRRWSFADKPHLAKLIGQRIVIHAGARKPRADELRDVRHRISEGESALDPTLATPLVDRVLDALVHKEALPIPLAAAVGTALLGEPKRCVDLFADTIADSDRIDQHMYAWPVQDVRPFPEPIPAAGAQGFWNWS